MAKAEVEEFFTLRDFPSVDIGIVKWPMSVIRLQSNEPESIVAAADHILTMWKQYDDRAAHIMAFTGEQPHNTITPIARRRGQRFELDLVLRNNRTTNEHPLGLFHPHAEVHHIKKKRISV